MKRLLLICLLMTCCASLFAQEKPVPRHARDLPPRTPVKFNPPSPTQRTIAGTQVLYLAENDVPLFKVHVLVRGGDYYDPAEKGGLSALTARAMRTGGAGKWTPESFDQTLENMAGQLSVSSSRDGITLDLNVLSRDSSKGLDLLFALMSSPSLDATALETERGRMIEGIRRQDDQPFALAMRAYRTSMYGKDSPWAHHATVESVKALTTADISGWHQTLFHRGNMIIGVSGRFQPAWLLQTLKTRLRAIPKGKGIAIPPPGKPVNKNSRIVIFPKKVQQATVLIGNPTTTLLKADGNLNEDRYAMEVMNFILGGGGFNSRITREVRSNRGLAYSAGSFWFFGTGPGFFAAYTQTRLDKVAEAMGVMRDECRRIRQESISAEELKLAQDSLVNKYVFKFSSTSAIVNQAVYLTYNGYPRGYLASYPDRIRSVTESDVLRVAQKYLHPEKFTHLVLGPEELEPAMKALAPTEINPGL